MSRQAVTDVLAVTQEGAENTRHIDTEKDGIHRWPSFDAAPSERKGNSCNGLQPQKMAEYNNPTFFLNG